MERQLEVIKIAGIAIFSRENATNHEANDIINLQHSVRNMVKTVKNYSGDKKELANQEVATLAARHNGFLGSRFTNLEQSIRELARQTWTE